MSLDIGLRIEVDTGGPEPFGVTLYSANVTHNVSKMWCAAGVYDALYNYEGEASGIIAVLETGLAHMNDNPEVYTPLNPENGWGDYKGAKKFLAEFLAYCKLHPQADVWRWK